MDEIAVSEFKAKCLTLLDQVQKTKKPLLITKFGKPLAEVVPVSPQSSNDWLDSMVGTAEITGDIISPVIDESDIEATRG